MAFVVAISGQQPVCPAKDGAFSGRKTRDHTDIMKLLTDFGYLALLRVLV